MTSYAKVKWDIIEKWNSDAKYDNQYLIQMASDNGVEIRNERADRKSIVAKVADSVIKSGIESGDYSVTEWGTFSQEQINFENYMGNLGVPEPELDLDVDLDAHEHEHEHEHEDDDGTVHSHPHSHDEEHSHDHEEESIIPVDLFNNKQQKQEEEHPDFKKMSKKALDVWAEEHGIILDRRKTKAHMIKELNKQL
tara:strand:+ start:348 stop:932 length:585 start_codon:yes stop_codon:yes gene_type:complete